MRCVIARYPFDLTTTGVPASMTGVRPESVTVGRRRRYPVKQVDQVLARQDRRDVTADEIRWAMTLLGFTCHDRPEAVGGPTPLRTAAALLGGTRPVEV
ncbi:SCO5918 family protein [Streptomyces sp. NPDC004629]|uniref:SCO5918 family protein n=1 Tax=Streptomyces sp. NPDC004629 TaxID=3364705 RepID=UPI0036CE70A3